jgi:(4-alkanoyl-5-oxo-2,5-dihydrofuran-3-yl)methyl phosphate reductase
MTNCFQWLPTIKSQAKVFSPTGNAKVAPISPKDIAAAAAVALTKSGHEGKIYMLTGPKLLSTPEQVAILSNTLGKRLECVDIPVSAASERMSQAGFPSFLIEALSNMWERIKEGEAETQTKDLEIVTGSKGENFEQWCSQHREAFLN